MKNNSIFHNQGFEAITVVGVVGELVDKSLLVLINEEDSRCGNKERAEIILWFYVVLLLLFVY